MDYEEELTNYMDRYFRGFAGFEMEHLDDFYNFCRKGKEFDLKEYELAHLNDEQFFELGAFLSPFFAIKKGENQDTVNYRTMRKLVIFTIKYGGDIIKEIIKKFL